MFIWKITSRHLVEREKYVSVHSHGLFIDVKNMASCMISEKLYRLSANGIYVKSNTLSRYQMNIYILVLQGSMCHFGRITHLKLRSELLLGSISFRLRYSHDKHIPYCQSARFQGMSVRKNKVPEVSLDNQSPSSSLMSLIGISWSSIVKQINKKSVSKCYIKCALNLIDGCSIKHFNLALLFLQYVKCLKEQVM